MIEKIIIIVLMSLVILFIALTVIIGSMTYIAFKDIFYRKECKSLLDIDLTGTHYEPHLDKIKRNIVELRERVAKFVSIKNDGLLLKARYYDLGSNNTVIMCHGYHAQSFNNFHASSKSFFSHGYNVLMIDERAHNDSEGKYTTVGIKEQYDILSWIKWVKDNTNTTNIILYGVSMGSSTLGLLSDKVEHTNVRAMVMDCGFTSFYDELFYKLRNKKMSSIILMFLRLYALVFLKIDIKTSTLDSLKNAKVPVYFIHGLNDELVPVEHTIASYNATSSDKKVHYVKDCGHTTAFLIDYDYLDNDLFSFINKYLK